MGKKEYEEIAKILFKNECNNLNSGLIRDLIAYFKRENPNFNDLRFKEYVLKGY